MRRPVDPYALRVCRLYVDGFTRKEVAARLRVPVGVVQEQVRSARAGLRAAGHADVGTVVALRRALRAEGLLDGIDLL